VPQVAAGRSGAEVTRPAVAEGATLDIDKAEIDWLPWNGPQALLPGDRFLLAGRRNNSFGCEHPRFTRPCSRHVVRVLCSEISWITGYPEKTQASWSSFADVTSALPTR
jgi:hypothetical protein